MAIWNDGGTLWVQVHCPLCSFPFGAQRVQAEMGPFICPAHGALTMHITRPLNTASEVTVTNKAIVQIGEERHDEDKGRQACGEEVAEDRGDDPRRAARRRHG